MNTSVSANDKAVIALLRDEGAQGVTQMVEKLGVTATAVRQRLTRLTALGLITREEFSEGRGRPIHKYSLTEEGFRSSGDNLSDLARVLWEEVHKIPDENTRKKVIAGVVERLSDQYRDSIQGETVDEKLRSIAKHFAQRDIPFSAVEENGKVVLQIVGCPYPDLAGGDHKICEMEKDLISSLTDNEISFEKESCGSGGQCCKFQTLEVQDTSENDRQT